MGRAAVGDARIPSQSDSRILVVLLPIQPPASVPGEVLEFDPRTWMSAAPVRNQDRVPGFWFQLGPTLAVVGIWE